MALKNILLICYPESCNIKDIITKYENKGKIISYAYIEHNLDINSDGTLKKTHYHVYLKLSKPTTKEQISKDFNIDKTLIETALNPNGIIRYLLHLDNKDKTPYKKEKIVSYGLDIDRMISMSKMGSQAEKDILLEILSWIEKGLSYKDIFELVLKLDYYAVYRSNYSVIRDLFTINNR